jgi:parvulin-like peptidyl-prolyl isomerase
MAAACVAAMALTACGDNSPSTAASAAGKSITMNEVADALDRFKETAQFEQLSQQSTPEEVAVQFERGYLSQIIRRYVLQQQAAEFDLTVTDDEIAVRLDQIKADFPNEEEFQRAVDNQGLTEQQLNDLVADQVLEEELRQEVAAEAGPSEEELRQAYEDRSDQFTQTRASHILFRADDEALARKIAGQLDDVKESQLESEFAKAATRYSEDPGTAKKGGDLGFFGAGQLVPEFEEAANSADVGQVVGPVKSEFGWHIILVTDRRTAPFDQVRDQLSSELAGQDQEQVFQEFMTDAYEQAEVQVNSRFGELDPATQQIVAPTAEDVPGAEEPPGGGSGDASPPPTPAQQ